MINGRVFIDSFSGPAADLPKGARTPENVLEALRKNGRVSTWDMSENGWLRNCIGQLLKDADIVEIKDEQYPWLRYRVVRALPTPSGRK